MDLQLYKVSAAGRINLGDLLAGVELAMAVKNDDGTVTVSPVNIVPTAHRTASTIQDVPLPGLNANATLDADPEPDDQPWDDDTAA